MLFLMLPASLFEGGYIIKVIGHLVKILGILVK
jgi:hypothetical protein